MIPSISHSSWLIRADCWWELLFPREDPLSSLPRHAPNSPCRELFLLPKTSFFFYPQIQEGGWATAAFEKRFPPLPLCGETTSAEWLNGCCFFHYSASWIMGCKAPWLGLIMGWGRRGEEDGEQKEVWKFPRPSRVLSKMLRLQPFFTYFSVSARCFCYWEITQLLNNSWW